MDLSLPRIKFETVDYFDEDFDFDEAVGDSSTCRSAVAVAGAAAVAAGGARQRAAHGGTTTAHSKQLAAGGANHPAQPQGNKRTDPH
ncbi:jg7483 [Pararge aegeria aegeria]|uniref:Jg7483 protein n=1 Tax=Pararge aegeria aegeria TaxID=348720 RepID=A0A8S4R5G8_9NEOP|nr:jg7483 [Pararge aegeria aegeria]